MLITVGNYGDGYGSVMILDTSFNILFNVCMVCGPIPVVRTLLMEYC